MGCWFCLPMSCILHPWNQECRICFAADAVSCMYTLLDGTHRCQCPMFSSCFVLWFAEASLQCCESAYCSALHSLPARFWDLCRVCFAHATPISDRLSLYLVHQTPKQAVTIGLLFGSNLVLMFCRDCHHCWGHQGGWLHSHQFTPWSGKHRHG